MRHHHRRFVQTSLISGFLLILGLIYFVSFFKQPMKVFQSNWTPTVEPMASYGTVTDFFAGVDVVDGDSLLVNEVIDVRFDLAQPEFIRIVPYKYQTGTANYKIGVRQVKASFNNGEALVETKKDGNNFLISIKRQDGFEIVGDVKINLSYQITRTINYLEDHDRLVYMVTGYQWPVPIERSRAVITLPDYVGTESLSANCFISQANLQTENCQISSIKSDSVGFDSLTEIKSGQGMIVSFTWPKGILVEPNFVVQGWWVIRDNPLILLPLIALALFYLNWLILAKEKWWKKTIPSVLPPTGLLPIEVGTIFDNKVNIDDVLLIFIESARRGYITIKKEENFWIINKIKEYKSIDRLEKRILDVFFAERDWWRSDEKDCRQSWRDALHIARRETYDQLTDKGFFVVSPTAVRWTYLIMAVIIWIGGAVFIPWYGGGISAIAIFITGFIVFIFGYYMPKKTPLGIAALRDAFAYRHYLKNDFNKLPAGEWINHISYVLLFHADRWLSRAKQKEKIDELSWFEYPYKKEVDLKSFLQALRRWERDMMQSRF